MFDRGILNSHSSPPNSQIMELKSNLVHSSFTDNNRLIYNPEASSDVVHYGRKFDEAPASQSLRNSNFSGTINRMSIEFQLKNEDIDDASSQAQGLFRGVKQSEESKDKDTAMNIKNVLNLSAYVPDEFVHYDYFDNYSSIKSNDRFNNLATPQGVNEVDKSQYSMEKTPGTNVSSMKNISKVSSLPFSNQYSTAAQSIQLSSKTEDVNILELSSFKGPPITSLHTAKENITISDCSYLAPLKKIRYAFKKITPTEVVEQDLSNPENLSYDELYHRAAKVASLMKELQDEARVIDKEINNFEMAKKSDQQILIEEAKLEKELKQKEDDAIFEALLNKYGNLTKSSIDDWTSFHENFYENNRYENPEHYRLLLLLRNHQFIQDFQKRKNSREKAKQKSNIIRLAETIDLPPSKMEQKAMEESDRKKRKPAIDPLVFEDRKMADVYGLTHKLGDAFIGNQPLKDRNGISKDSSAIKNLDDSFRPKRARGRRGNNDTDNSDHTPVVSDAEDVVPPKRTRNNRVINDSIVSSRTGAKTASSSRESSPGAGPKIFASGKRVGRPPGASKAQVKLPSKLKSVQAAGETTQTNGTDRSEDLANIEGSDLLSRFYVDRRAYMICNNNDNNSV